MRSPSNRAALGNERGSRSVQWAPILGLAGQFGALALLDAGWGIPRASWVAGMTVGVGVAVFLGVGLARSGSTFRHGIGPANLVTLTRSVLVGAVAALIVARAEPLVIVAVSVLALSLDWADGRVARRTGTTSVLGARFDMEVDALLILLLSWQVASSVGAWVLVIGLARYLKLVASWAWPWLGETAPPRYWAKVVAAVQGVTLVAVATGLFPLGVSAVVLLVALALLAESFGNEIWWLWRHRDAAVTPRSNALVAAASVFAFVAVLAALMAPYSWDGAGQASWRMPLEAPVYGLLVLLIPASFTRLRTLLAFTAGVLLGVLALLKALDLAFRAALNRAFDPLIDWTYTNELLALIRDSTDRLLSPVLLAGLVGLVLVLLLGLPLALGRVTRVIEAHRIKARRALSGILAAWVTLALAAAVGGPAPTITSAGTASYAWQQVARVPDELKARAEFERDTRTDPLSDASAQPTFAGLAGKDVLVVFVESYGRVALSDPSLAPGVDAVLDDGAEKLAKAGVKARSAWMTSPTFGALSWLAHSTLQTGLWVDSQSRYDTVMGSPRQSLSRLFGQAGWRTVASVPANTEDWPQGDFYNFDHLYDSRNVGYRGPRFGYPTMPDQYTLEAFWQHELAPGDRAPVMAEIDLISSHAPWSRTPRMVDPAAVGDGSIFAGMPEQLPSEPEIWQSTERIRTAYGEAVQYSLRALFDFIARHGSDDLVVVMLGDHQPATVVSGSDANRDVPITVLAKDDAVLQQIAPWGWQDGVRPTDEAPQWRMDAFRDAFVAAFGTRSGAETARQVSPPLNR